MFITEYPITIKTEGIYVTIKASPGASKNKLGKCELISDNERALKIFITAKAEDGKANKAIIELLSKELKIPKTHISLVKGASSRIKTFLFKNIDQNQVLSLFR